MAQCHNQSGEPIKCRTVFLPIPQPNGFTAKDLRRLLEAGVSNFELQDGAVLPATLETAWHDEARDVLKAALRSAAPRGCAVSRGQGMDMGDTVPVPDLLMVARSAVTADSLVFQPEHVHLVVEIVSPGTTTRDRRLRPLLYAEAGIQWFWRVENEGDEMVVYTFELMPGGGSYAPSGVFRKELHVDRPFKIEIELPEIAW